MPTDNAPPPQATLYCRHYGKGPTCARGVDLVARRDTRPCQPPSKGLGLIPATPGPLGHCPQRQDFTNDERSRWLAYINAQLSTADPTETDE